MTEINHSVVNLTWRDGIRVNVIPRLWPNWEGFTSLIWVWWFSYLVPVGETLTSDLHHHLFKFWKSSKCKAGIMMCQGMKKGWNHFSSIYRKPCMFKSVRHLVTKNTSIISSYASLHVWICTWNSLQMEPQGKSIQLGEFCIHSKSYIV